MRYYLLILLILFAYASQKSKKNSVKDNHKFSGKVGKKVDVPMDQKSNQQAQLPKNSQSGNPKSKTTKSKTKATLPNKQTINIQKNQHPSVPHINKIVEQDTVQQITQEEVQQQQDNFGPVLEKQTQNDKIQNQQELSDQGSKQGQEDDVQSMTIASDEKVKAEIQSKTETDGQIDEDIQSEALTNDKQDSKTQTIIEEQQIQSKQEELKVIQKVQTPLDIKDQKKNRHKKPQNDKTQVQVNQDLKNDKIIPQKKHPEKIQKQGKSKQNKQTKIPEEIIIQKPIQSPKNINKIKEQPKQINKENHKKKKIKAEIQGKQQHKKNTHNNEKKLDFQGSIKPSQVKAKNLQIQIKQQQIKKVKPLMQMQQQNEDPISQSKQDQLLSQQKQNQPLSDIRSQQKKEKPLNQKKKDKPVSQNKPIQIQQKNIDVDEKLKQLPNNVVINQPSVVQNSNPTPYTPYIQNKPADLIPQVGNQDGNNQPTNEVKPPPKTIDSVLQTAKQEPQVKPTLVEILQNIGKQKQENKRKQQQKNTKFQPLANNNQVTAIIPKKQQQKIEPAKVNEAQKQNKQQKKQLFLGPSPVQDQNQNQNYGGYINPHFDPKVEAQKKKILNDIINNIKKKNMQQEQLQKTQQDKLKTEKLIRDGKAKQITQKSSLNQANQGIKGKYSDLDIQAMLKQLQEYRRHMKQQALRKARGEDQNSKPQTIHQQQQVVQQSVERFDKKQKTGRKNLKNDEDKQSWLLSNKKTEPQKKIEKTTDKQVQQDSLLKEYIQLKAKRQKKVQVQVIPQTKVQPVNLGPVVNIKAQSDQNQPISKPPKNKNKIIIGIVIVIILMLLVTIRKRKANQQKKKKSQASPSKKSDFTQKLTQDDDLSNLHTSNIEVAERLDQA